MLNLQGVQDGLGVKKTPIKATVKALAKYFLKT